MSRFSPIKSKVLADGHQADKIAPPEPESPPPKVTRPAREISRDKSDCVTLTFNEAKNGLQLHFPNKPSDEVRAELKAAGWRWSFRNACWYHRDKPENLDFAQRFVARQNCPSGRPPSVEPDQNSTGATGDEIKPMPTSNIISFPTPHDGGRPQGLPAWRLRLTRP